MVLKRSTGGPAMVQNHGPWQCVAYVVPPLFLHRVRFSITVPNPPRQRGGCPSDRDVVDQEDNEHIMPVPRGRGVSYLSRCSSCQSSDLPSLSHPKKTRLSRFSQSRSTMSPNLQSSSGGFRLRPESWMGSGTRPSCWLGLEPLNAEAEPARASCFGGGTWVC